MYLTFFLQGTNRCRRVSFLDPTYESRFGPHRNGDPPMTNVIPSGKTLGARVEGLDLSKPLSPADRALVLESLGRYGVLSFPNQKLDAGQQKAFAAPFGTLEINVAAGPYTVAPHKDVMVLSNIVENGRNIGLGDAGQGWHTDMSYSADIAFANVLYGIKIPYRDGVSLGGTQFANMHAAYDDLPAAMKTKLEGKTALHDFAKFWDMMRSKPGTTRGPLTEEQRRQKPPVSHPVFLTHPVTGRKVLYCNPGYAIRINELPAVESDEVLEMLFAHQLQDKYRYMHRWAEGDVLIWENIGTIHNAIADYGPHEPRLIHRCQVMADKVFDRGFVQQTLRGAVA